MKNYLAQNYLAELWANPLFFRKRQNFIKSDRVDIDVSQI